MIHFEFDLEEAKAEVLFDCIEDAIKKMRQEKTRFYEANWITSVVWCQDRIAMLYDIKSALKNKRVPSTPRECLADFMKTSGLTQQELADVLQVSRCYANRIVNGRRNITAHIARRLEDVTGMSAEHWLHLQSLVELDKAQSKLIALRQSSPELRAKLDAYIASDEPLKLNERQDDAAVELDEIVHAKA